MNSVNFPVGPVQVPTESIQHPVKSQKGKLGIILSVVLLLVMCGGAYYLGIQNGKTSPAIQQNIPSSNITATLTQETTPSIAPISNATDWETYTNVKYGFELQHPANSTVETRTNDGVNSYQYIRIQNYTDQEVIKNNGKLVEGQYYLEISIYDHQLGQRNTDTCPESLVNPKKADLGARVTAYRGNGLGGGDSSPYMYAICATKPNVDYYIQASERFEAVSSKIIDSVKFTN